MYRPALIAVTALSALMLAHPPVHGQGEPDGEATDTASTDPAGEQELGARLGLEMGRRSSPGGLSLAGNYLYRLSEDDWFDGGLSFTFGSGDAACFRDRFGDYLCDHAVLDGIAIETLAGVRRFLPSTGRFTPFARAGLGVRIVRFSGDELTGVAIPLVVGGGIRARVTPAIAVLGGADLRAGLGMFGNDLGAEPHITLTIAGGVEFRL